jgi:hypothetical protein
VTPAALSAADPQPPVVTVTQELLNSIHVRPQLILDPFPAYAEKYLPFAMAASMESTRKGRLWTCWAGASWRYRGGIIFEDSCFNEHSVVELADGRLWMLSRGMREPFQSFSRDGGATEILFARFREEDVQRGGLVSSNAAFGQLVKSRAHGMRRPRPEPAPPRASPAAAE